ncbi:uncharacterized protein FOMMEDRAFT_159752 [Fomitiporia mediterranea MF3/22]|uniref:uncharacterized protein n=1 Tax=Fomitiporia mediterranea (strain MF3/22) TaxID=694068 RepID=UPI0004409C0C|nr:uncharacterized protein FOMMEDRAFT_159752 [Fomitiporia mediterranea MF3/22]EJD00120.1 hypothetical protein FOMMEDRAFT_159752 [Fomitiporia mediterranea MF3/22]
MDAVRRQFGISRPFLWFELYGRNSSADGENGDCSGDEEYPLVELPPGPELDDDDVEGFEVDVESDAMEYRGIGGVQRK